MPRQSLNASGVGVIFSADGRDCGVNHILQAAEFRGELQPLRSSWIAASDAVQKAESEGIEPAEEALEKLAADFRYARNLVTADECEQWLAAVGVTPDEFSDHIVRCCLAAPGGVFDPERSDAETVTLGVIDAEQARSFEADVLLSDKFQQMAGALAWRIAASNEDKDQPPPASEQIARHKERGLENLRAAGITPDDWPDGAKWFDELVILEARFRGETERLLTPENQQRALTDRRLALLQFDTEILELESQSAAREALLCMEEDGISLEELAAQNHHPLRRGTSFLDDFPKDWQQTLLSATPGAALPPFAVGDGFQLCRLVAKRDPSLADSEVLRRVNDAVLQARFRELESRHIRWHVNLEIESD